MPYIGQAWPEFILSSSSGASVVCGRGSQACQKTSGPVVTASDLPPIIRIASAAVAHPRKEPQKIKLDAASAQTWAGQPPVNSFFFIDHADAFRTALPDRISRRQRVERIDRFGEIVAELFAPSFKSGRKVHHQAANAEITWRHTPARCRFDHVKDLFTLAEAEEENAHCPEIKGACAEPNHVRCDPLEFAHQNPNDLRSFRDLQL